MQWCLMSFSSVGSLKEVIYLLFAQVFWCLSVRFPPLHKYKEDEMDFICGVHNIENFHL